ncbi:helix-turn-helix transcriptional regulator [Streptomyces sp. ML-6]|uniref:helix-turn-helix domain-containing protein n=1 Tax=Streptomyces sp. ML-6 TaxID=2982693 RepID=UPI0024BF7482|nr:helix-turn-helix transcriptional regulator [Streptomyces sp. ML-6]MDK0525071.1 helix-turn-helix transcriptional regulator [Streptomyces sp. ML-6]
MTAVTRVGPLPVGGGPAVSLTDHELRVLELVAHGHTHEDIARQLFTTPKGITPTVNRAVKKLGAANAPHAVLLACRAGLLDGRPRRHGDHAGFAAHQYRGEEPCEACWAGERAYRAERRAARKSAKVRAA